MILRYVHMIFQFWQTFEDTFNRAVESLGGPRETIVYGPLRTWRLTFVWTEYASRPESFGALEACKFGAQNKGISFDYPIFLLFSWYPGPLFLPGPREIVTPFTPSLRAWMSLKTQQDFL